MTIEKKREHGIWSGNKSRKSMQIETIRLHRFQFIKNLTFVNVSDKKNDDASSPAESEKMFVPTSTADVHLSAA